MKNAILLFVLFGFITTKSAAQGYSPSIEPCPCSMKIDKKLVAKCGYLVVPENRQKPTGNKVKIPFVYARRPEQDSTKNFILYTTGGPGYSTIGVGDSLRFASERFMFGGFIFFDQRGSKNAKPCLDCPEIDLAIKKSYQQNVSKDSLVAIAVKKCRKNLVAQGIDISAYNTIESAADINDLKEVLHLDALTLLGISYSGGLMLTVARNHPKGIKSLLLNSPLPGFVNYEEHALFNHNEALNQIFDNVEADSAQNAQFKGLRGHFRQYFTTITNKKFTIKYLEKGTTDSLNIDYTKNELLDAVIDRLNNGQWQTVPSVINDLVNGKHQNYIKEVLDGKFYGNKSLSHGMRYSIYCSEQIAYSDKKLVKKQDEVLPWLAGYPFNNVNHQICDCWKVKPEPAVAKTPVYSQIPALISAGDLDPWCRPFYNTSIKRTMPNSQLLVIKNRAHVAGFGPAGTSFLTNFMANPYKKLVSPTKNVVVE